MGRAIVTVGRCRGYGEHPLRGDVNQPSCRSAMSRRVRRSAAASCRKQMRPDKWRGCHIVPVGLVKVGVFPIVNTARVCVCVCSFASSCFPPAQFDLHQRRLHRAALREAKARKAATVADVSACRTWRLIALVYASVHKRRRFNSATQFQARCLCYSL